MPLVLASTSFMTLTLDPVHAEDRMPSVAFDIVFEWRAEFQEGRVSDTERWFHCQAIDDFERQLFELQSRPSGEACLVDMSDRLALRFVRNDDRVVAHFQARPSLSGGNVVVEVPAEASLINEVWRRLQSFEKWW